MYKYKAKKCNIKQILDEKKMSQQELALKLNLTTSHLSDYSNMRSTMGMNAAMTIAKALNVSVEDLYEWEEIEIK